LLFLEIIDTEIFCLSNSNQDILIDGDWNDKYGLVLLIEEKRKLKIKIRENFININFDFKFNYPLIRWIDHEYFLIADQRNHINKENLYIYKLDGTKCFSFNCGDGIEDIVVGKEGIWVSYFDEGVYGEGISEEGLVLFTYEGKPSFRYHSDLLERPSISDCYAICKGKSSLIWLFPYTHFPLIRVNPVDKKLESYHVPEVVHGADSLCVRGKFGYFHHADSELYAWEIGEGDPQLLGNLQKKTRGLDTRQNNHFISIDERKIILYRIINPKEY
jgi:hypothetical protein